VYIPAPFLMFDLGRLQLLGHPSIEADLPSAIADSVDEKSRS
jgi:hypothetical protein